MLTRFRAYRIAYGLAGWTKAVHFNMLQECPYPQHHAMRYNAAALAFASLFLSCPLQAKDTIKWAAVKANITAQGVLTVEITAKVHMDNSQGRVELYLQDEEKPLGNPNEARVTVARGDRTLTLKRTITIPKSLTVVDVWTPLYVGLAKETSIAEMGHVQISWSDVNKPSVTVIHPEKYEGEGPPPTR